MIESPSHESPLPDGDATVLLRRIEAGDRGSQEALLELVYDELRALAGQIFGAQGGATLQPTALVHEAYLRLIPHAGELTGRRHFFVVASMAMRQMLRDQVRARRALKRGGDLQRVSLSGLSDDDGRSDTELERLDAALESLGALSPRQARIVELRYLTGLSVQEVADIIGVSVATVGNDWRTARAYLRRELSQSA